MWLYRTGLRGRGQGLRREKRMLRWRGDQGGEVEEGVEEGVEAGVEAGVEEEYLVGAGVEEEHLVGAEGELVGEVDHLLVEMDKRGGEDTPVVAAVAIVIVVV